MICTYYQQFHVLLPRPEVSVISLSLSLCRRHVHGKDSDCRPTASEVQYNTLHSPTPPLECVLIPHRLVAFGRSYRAESGETHINTSYILLMSKLCVKCLAFWKHSKGVNSRESLPQMKIKGCSKCRRGRPCCEGSLPSSPVQ